MSSYHNEIILSFARKKKKEKNIRNAITDQHCVGVEYEWGANLGYYLWILHRINEFTFTYTIPRTAAIQPD